MANKHFESLFADFAAFYATSREEKGEDPNQMLIAVNGKNCVHFCKRFDERISNDPAQFSQFLERLKVLVSQHKSRIMSIGKKLPDTGTGDYSISYLKDHTLKITLTKQRSVISGVTILLTFTSIVPANGIKFRRWLSLQATL